MPVGQMASEVSDVSGKRQHLWFTWRSGHVKVFDIQGRRWHLTLAGAGSMRAKHGAAAVLGAAAALGAGARKGAAAAKERSWRIRKFGVEGLLVSLNAAAVRVDAAAWALAAGVNCLSVLLPIQLVILCCLLRLVCFWQTLTSLS